MVVSNGMLTKSDREAYKELRKYGRLTVGFTITMPRELEVEVADLAIERSFSRSRTVSYLTKMGLIYLNILKEQQKTMEDFVEQKKEEDKA